MTERLLPCPFCGDATATALMASRCVMCPDCGSRTGIHDDLADAVAAWNRRASGWISVEERLPEDYVEVLVLHAGGDQSVGQHVAGSGWASQRGALGSDRGRVDPGPPTHWMPLPEAPK